ncbi:Flp family type IVb pilin [bacterium]|nr:Flp family type IVb pilin [bacterium]
MKTAFQAVKTFILSEDGPTAVEYAVVVAMIILACIAGLSLFGTNLNTWFNTTAGNVGGMDTGAGLNP